MVNPNVEVLYAKQIADYHEYWLHGKWPSQRLTADVNGIRLKHFADHLGLGSKAFYRDFFEPGHFTGSALVCSRDMKSVLLTLHAKLNMWLQLGGHADGDLDLFSVASRELEEESGLKNAVPFRGRSGNLFLFDVDDHAIPANKSEPEHLHIDARYLFLADIEEPLVVSDESHELRWFSLAEARSVTQEESMHRMFDKLEILALG